MDNNKNVKIDAVISANRAIISKFGALVGTGYFKPITRECDTDYEAKKLAIVQSGSNELFINRPIRRTLLRVYNVEEVGVDLNLAGDPVIVINGSKEEAKLVIPLTAGAPVIGKVEPEAIQKAINGDTNVFFTEPSKLHTAVTELNNSEISHLTVLRDKLNSMIQSLNTANADNKKKVDTYTNEMINSSKDLNGSGDTSGAAYANPTDVTIHIAQHYEGNARTTERQTARTPFGR